ncbi:MAG: radical SAM protein [Bacteroidales bacterium]
MTGNWINTKFSHAKAFHKLDCLLINPPDDFSRYPYLGLCFLAGSLRKHGMRVEIIDSAALGLSIKEVISFILMKKPKIIGISIMSMTLPHCFQLIKAIKMNCPEVSIVVGGAHVNADPGILIHLDVKYGFIGESEYAFAKYCEKVLGGQWPEAIEGLIVNDGGEINVSSPPTIVSNLDLLPNPAYELLPLDKYYSPSTHLKTISMITSRGCPYNCVYCSRLQKTPYRSMSPNKILNQIEDLINRDGIQWIEFVDEIFTLDRAKVIEMCEGILKKGLRFYWGVGTRVDKLDEELIKLMRGAGCRKIGFGVESGSERVRYLENKRIKNEQYIRTVEICRKYRIKTMASYIFGHPTETEDEMWQTIKFAGCLQTDVAYFNQMIPIPGSELFENAKRAHSIPSDVWVSFMNGKVGYPIFYPEGIKPEKMANIYRQAWFRYYFSLKSLYKYLWLLLRPGTLFRSLKAFMATVFGKRYKRSFWGEEGAEFL